MKGIPVIGIYFRAILTQSTNKHTNIGVVISKKHAKLAIIRNTIKRTTFRVSSQMFLKLPQINIVFLMTKNIPRNLETTALYKKRISKIIEKDITTIITTIIQKYEKFS